MTTGASISSSIELTFTSASDLLPHLSPVMSSLALQSAVEAASSPSVPLKLAQCIWEQKYMGMEVLLSGKLGSDPTFFDSLTSSLRNKPTRKKETIEPCIYSFNTYTAVMAKSRQTELRIYWANLISESMLAGHMMACHGSILTSTSGICMQLTIVYSLGVDSSVWTLHFGGAKARM